MRFLTTLLVPLLASLPAGCGLRDSGDRAPVISGGEPSGRLPAGTTQATMSVETDEPANCRWSSTSATSYANLANTFTTTGGTSHWTTLTGLEDGRSYTRYVRCLDDAGNASDSSYAISFHVAISGPGVVTGITFDWTTHRERAPGSDNWPVTWSDDGHQYTSWGDGGGFGGTNSRGRVSLGVARVEGDYDTYTGVNRFGGLDPEFPSTISGKSYGILSLGGVLYMWVSPGSNTSGYQRFTLYKSTDKAQSWSPTSVVWEGSTHNLVNGTFLNFGQDYAGARDGYVYIYAADITTTSSLAIQSPGVIYLLRVPVAEIENQAAYEFYTGTDPATPTWGSFADREPAFTSPDGVSWTTASVIHVPGIDRYVLITEHTASLEGNVQMHEAGEPWGPWTEFYRAAPFGAGQVDGSTFYWTFAPKWFRNAGVDFTLVFTGVGENDSWNTLDGSFILSSLPSPPSRQ